MRLIPDLALVDLRLANSDGLELVKSLGADRVVDYTQGDFTRCGEVYDILFDAVGKISASRIRRLLVPNGVYLSVMGSTNVLPDDLTFLKDVIEAGEVKAVIDRCYPLEQIGEAHRYVDSGHKRGNVVITVRRGKQS